MDHNLPDIIDPKHPVLDAFVEISQARTNFQLSKFVMGQHDTDEQRYKQVVLELQSVLTSVKKGLLELKKFDIKINKLKASDDETDQIDAALLLIDKENVEIGLIGAKKELNYLLTLWKSFEHKYTAEDIEAAQEEYWTKRLTRQASLEAIGNGGKVAWASLDALNQIGQLPSLDPNFYAQPQEVQTEQSKEIE